MNKLTKAMFSFLVISSMMPMGSLNAKESDLSNAKSKINESVIEKQIDMMFSRFDTTRKILLLPDGAYLQGEAKDYVDDASSDDNLALIAIYNSETDTRAISVETAKDMEKKVMMGGYINLPIITRGTGVPETKRTLEYGDRHLSAPFTEPGWRVSNIKFYPSEGSGGPYLKWTSYSDSGLVGNTSQCLHTINNGPLEGTILNAGITDTVLSTDWMMYYTKNPVHGTKYLVENV